METASQKGPSLALWKVKAGVGRMAFKLVRFYYCNITIKLVLVLMVLVSCLGCLEDVWSGQEINNWN